MCTDVKSRFFRIVAGMLLLLAANGSSDAFGNNYPMLSEVLPTMPERARDIDLNENWMANTVVLVGTGDDDKIRIVVDDERIRFHVDGRSVGRIDLDDLPNRPQDEDEDSPSELEIPLNIIVSGGSGNDNISLEVEPSDDPAADIRNRAIFLLYGDEGDDTLTSVNADQVVFVGGLGTDLLMGDGRSSTYAGCDMLSTNFETLELICMPDMSMDILVPGHPDSTAFRNYYQQFEPVTYVSPRVTSVELTPKKLPNVPVIASREKQNSTIIDPTPIEFDSILLDQDRVINKIGCIVQDVTFTDDGMNMVFTDVE
ncbi:hypothetical protein [Rhodopirellula europaea]|uniref:hypothetical protein n=1 Tax=Rhodopirellula europaea TaxID=1263866 RepID=UPI003D27D35E|tara:strand:+ start:5866 stop:6804 length:939 start_codon:yes stop_codon:yes gene_type:complete